jgi:DNA mismatch repair ATPase MutS
LGGQHLPKLAEVLEHVAGEAGESSPLRDMWVQIDLSCTELRRACALASRVIDFSLAPREFLLNPEENEEVREIKEELDQIEEELNQIHDDINRWWWQISGKQNQVRIKYVDADGNKSCVWQFRLSDSNATIILQKCTNIHVKSILKDGVHFSTKELEQLGTKKKDVLETYLEKQREIVDEIMGVARTFVPVLERTSTVVSELDVLASLAYVAGCSQNGYCRPEMTDGEDNGLGIEVCRTSVSLFSSFCFN